VRTDLLTVEESIDAVLAAVNARLVSIREGDALAQGGNAVVAKDRSVVSR
jgi:ABC-type branched-subunit amino acid transport system ATPase component